MNYVADWPGYPGKAERLLRDVDAGYFYLGYDFQARTNRYGAIPKDGEWMRLGRIGNVGGQLLRWMVEKGILERKGDGMTVAALMNDWYRLASSAEPGDFGDLWVPD